MPTASHNSPEVLRKAILADAQRESEAILAHAKTQAASLLARSAAEAERLRRTRLEQANVEAGRRRERILATVPAHTARLRSARLEELLESVREAARHGLAARDGSDDRSCVVALAAEAIRRMGGETFEVKLSPESQTACGPGLVEEIAGHVGRPRLHITLAIDPAVGRGVVVQDVAGHQVYDNRLASRLDRLWPELRWRLALQASFILPGDPKGEDT